MFTSLSNKPIDNLIPTDNRTRTQLSIQVHFNPSTAMILKLSILTIFLTVLSTNAVQPSPKPLEYTAIVNRCFTAYKVCASGNKPGCRSCESACGDQDILRQNAKFATVCTLLRDYCNQKKKAPSADTCTETQCVEYNKQCRRKGLKDVSCGYCANACRSCPKQYKQCRPNQPAPTPPPGCQVRACTYYSNLCKLSYTADKCQFCVATCSSLCDDEAEKCKPFVPGCSNAVVKGKTTLELGDGGADFSDASAVNNCLYNPIRKINVRAGDGVGGIQAVFQDGTAIAYGVPKLPVTDTIDLNCGERITKIIRRTGIFLRFSIIAELTFFTSEGRKFGPYGGKLKGMSAPVTTDFGKDYLLYFFGKSGDFLDRLGFAYGRFDREDKSCWLSGLWPDPFKNYLFQTLFK